MRFQAVAFRTLALSTAFAFGALPAACEDYPYTGLFTMELPGKGGGRLEERCALSFIEQRKDGDWSTYHVDLDEFQKTGIVRYLELANGTCAVDPSRKLESCTTRLDKSYPAGEGTTAHDLILKATDERIDMVMIQNLADLSETIKNPASGAAFSFLRCPFSAEHLLSLRAPGVTDLPEDDLTALRDAKDELLSDPVVKALVAKLKAN